MSLLLIAIGAAIGAPARYLTDRAVQTRHDSVFPWGTLTVNVVGSFVLGLFAAAAAGDVVGPRVLAGVGTGFCGALVDSAVSASPTPTPASASAASNSIQAPVWTAKPR